MNKPFVIDPAREARANNWQLLGDGLTYMREATAPFVGALIAARNGGIGVGSFTAGVLATDLVDGASVRHATKIRGYEIKTNGAEADPRADRLVTHCALGGLMIRGVRNRDVAMAATAGANLALSLWRNKRMQENRQTIHDFQLDPKELRASKLNKAKMALQSAGLILAAGTQERPGMALGLITAGTMTGIVGERQFRKKVNLLLDEA